MNVVVVGAGISGLTCAYRLNRAGHAVVVLEQDGRLGGRMSTVQRGLHRVDIGANLLLENYTHVRALSEELGLDSDWFELQSGSGGVLHDHELTSFSPQSLTDILRYKGLSFGARLRLVAFLLRSYGWKSELDFYDLNLGGDAFDDENAYDGTVRVMGKEVAEWVVEPFVRTFHFHSARRMSMKYFDALASLLSTVGGFTPHAFRSAMIGLPTALDQHVQVKRHHTALSVRKAANGWVASCEEGEQQADVVVLAVPAPVALQLLDRSDSEQRSYLRGVTYAPTLSVAFEVPLDVASDFEGIWVPYAESTLISECSNESCKGFRTEHTCVFNFGLHEESAVSLMQEDDASVFNAVEREWTRLFPQYDGHMTGIHVQRWPLAMPVYGVGFINQTRRFWEQHQGDHGLFLCGDYLNHPWIEGSVRCGEKVASLIRS